MHHTNRPAFKNKICKFSTKPVVVGTHKQYSYLRVLQISVKGPDLVFIQRILKRAVRTPSTSLWTRGVQFLLDGVHTSISKENINCDFQGGPNPLPPSGSAHVLCIVLGASLLRIGLQITRSFKNHLDSSVGRASAFGAGSQESRSGLHHTICVNNGTGNSLAEDPIKMGCARNNE